MGRGRSWALRLGGLGVWGERALRGACALPPLAGSLWPRDRARWKGGVWRRTPPHAGAQVVGGRGGGRRVVASEADRMGWRGEWRAREARAAGRGAGGCLAAARGGEGPARGAEGSRGGGRESRGGERGASGGGGGRARWACCRRVGPLLPCLRPSLPPFSLACPPPPVLARRGAALLGEVRTAQARAARCRRVPLEAGPVAARLPKRSALRLPRVVDPRSRGHAQPAAPQGKPRTLVQGAARAASGACARARSRANRARTHPT